MQDVLTKLALETATLLFMGQRSRAIEHVKTASGRLLESYAAAHPLQAVKFGLFSRSKVKDLSSAELRRVFGEWLGDQSDETLDAFVASVTAYAYAGETVYEFLKSGRLFQVLAIVQQTGAALEFEDVDLSHLEK